MLAGHPLAKPITLVTLFLPAASVSGEQGLYGQTLSKEVALRTISCLDLRNSNENCEMYKVRVHSSVHQITEVEAFIPFLLYLL